jgi:hypothetical protein
MAGYCNRVPEKNNFVDNLSFVGAGAPGERGVSFAGVVWCVLGRLNPNTPANEMSS